jgi:hypothetical protein
MQPGAANQAGHLIAFGRMADQSGWFVDDQQVGVFVNDIEHAEILSKDSAGRKKAEGRMKKQIGLRVGRINFFLLPFTF